MNVGFTGTRKGLTIEQEETLWELLDQYWVQNCSFHHGDCIGADAKAAEVAARLGYNIHMHPPTNQSARAFTSFSHQVVHLPKGYIERNHDIVDQSSLSWRRQVRIRKS